MKGRTGIRVLEGVMKKELCTEILESTLLPFIHSVYPTQHCFMQDNDPKHVSGHTQCWSAENGIHW